jgi:hypothetical protein
MSAILSDEDLYKLTGFKRAGRQQRTLQERGIPFKQVGRHTIVLEQHAAAWVEGRRVQRFVEPDMSSVK